MGSANKVASGVVWSMISNVVNAVYGFISVPILIRYFGKAEYGLIGLALSINVYMQLMDMGFNNTNLRFFSAWLAKHNFEKVKKLFQTSLAFYGTIGLLNAIVLLVVCVFSQQLFNVTVEQDSVLKTLIYILAISAFISWYTSCFDQLIGATENVGWIKKISLLPKVLQVAVLFITVYLEFSIELYFLLTTFATIVTLPFLIGKIKKETPYVNFIPKFDWPTLKEMLPYAINIFSFSFFQFSFFNLRPIFLGMQGTVESVADYRILNGIVGAVSMFSGVFLNALLPSSAKAMAQGDKKAFYRVAYDATKYISIVLGFCVFGMMTIEKELINVYVGGSYYYLIPWFNIWLICTLGTHNMAISSLILSGTDIRAVSYSSIIASVLGLVVTWFTIKQFQIGGVVLGFVVYTMIQQIFWYFIYWPKYMKINSWKVFSYSFVPYVVIGIVFCLIINQFFNFDLSPWSLLLIKGLAFAIPYMLLVLLLLNDADKTFIVSLVNRKKG